MNEKNTEEDKYLEITQAAIAKFREKLLDLSNRNNFINLSLNPRSNKNIRLIDELPNRIYQQLSSGEEFELISLPLPKDEPEDEQTDNFLSELEYEKLNNSEYLSAIEELGENFDESSEESLKLIRKLKDDLRERLGMPKLISPETVSIEEYAKSINITPNYEVPIDEGLDEVEDKHQDNNLQTLFYPDDMERKCRLLNKEYQRFINEKGTNTLYISFGCLEWYEANHNKRISPLLLYPIKLSEEKSSKGRKHIISGSQSELVVNLSLSKRLKNDFGIELPDLSEEISTPELYFDLFNKLVISNKDNWKIKRFINITIHSYSKLSMFEDLDPEKWKKNGFTLGNQQGVRDLFTGSEDGSSSPIDHDLDERSVIEKVPVLIDNVDSSQYSTIIDSLSGKNLVIQGPPGTGKSTTIANMLSSLMHERKKVLFMSEKKAALDVVYKKLKDKELGSFVFKLSSTTEKKTEFVNELKDRLETEKKEINYQDIDILNDGYYRQIDKIKRYKSFLIKKYFNLEISGYEILTKFAKSKYKSNKLTYSFEELVPHKDITEITKNELFEIYGSIDTVEEVYKNLINKYKKIVNHPWYGLLIKENNPFLIENLKKDLIKIKESVSEKILLIKDINKLTKINLDYNNLNNQFIEAIISSDKVDLTNNYIGNINSLTLFKTLKEFQEKIEKYSKFKLSEKRLSDRFDLKDIFNVSSLEKYSRFIKNSGFLAFLFDKNYKEAKSYYKSIKLDGKFNKSSAIQDFDSIKIYNENFSNILNLEKDLNNNYDILKDIFVDSFSGVNTPLGDVNTLCQIIDQETLSDQQILYIIDNKENLNELKNIIINLTNKSNQISDKFLALETLIDDSVFFPSKNNLDEILFKLNSIDLSDDQSLDSFIKFNYYSNDINPLLKTILKTLISSGIDISQARIAFDFILYKSLAHLLFDREKEVQELNVIDFENEIKQFKNLDQSVFELKRDHLINNLLAIIPTLGVNRGKASDLSELSLIEREISKQKAHIPFRQLLKRAGQALRDIKPCFMLSPISLSDITDIKPEMFDVLIIDEASQMRIEDALGGILRSKQIIIVGDPEQLPPSNFFDSTAVLDDEGIVDDDESILDLAISKFKPKRMLKWHYRSKHESLINFSNKYFYNDALIIPPSPNDNFAVKHNKVMGIYNSRSRIENNSSTGIGGTNELECKKISESVVDFMKKNPSKSCLVVTMNNVQRDLIDEQIRLMSYNDPLVDDYKVIWQDTMEPFVVKNLENVQGDERDFIFISTLFGPNKDGQVMQRFGPINNPKGHRRLNVLFTRAKEGIELFTSLNSEDVKDSENAQRGRLIFKKYIEYSRNQMLDSGTTTGRGTDSDFEDWVKSELELHGYEVIPQVGVSGFFIDLGVKHKDYPHGYLAGVECDGATYHSSLSARDNDIVRQKVLEGYGWNIYRIWSTNWFKNPEKELERLLSYLNGIKSSEKRSA